MEVLIFGGRSWHFDDKSLKNGIFRQITVTGLNILFHYLYLPEVHFVMQTNVYQNQLHGKCLFLG